MSFEN